MTMRVALAARAISIRTVGFSAVRAGRRRSAAVLTIELLALALYPSFERLRSANTIGYTSETTFEFMGMLHISPLIFSSVHVAEFMEQRSHRGLLGNLKEIQYLPCRRFRQTSWPSGQATSSLRRARPPPNRPGFDTWR